MEDAVKDQSSSPGNSGRPSSKLLRYPLRSATKSKDDKTPVPDSTISSASKRGRPPSTVSKSMGVLDLSGKDKPAKPARRLSIPTKTTSSPAPKPAGNVTPISEARANRSAISQGKSDTPASDVSRSSYRKKFSVLSSASYWLSQIKLSESDAKHSISLGFFKLALEAGCEPIQRMREELKAYARKHNLVDLGELAKEVFESYKIVENFEQMQVSETFSHILDGGTQSSDDDVHSSSTIGTLNLKPKLLNNGGSPPVKESAEEVTKKINPAPRIRAEVTKNSSNLKSASKAVGHKIQKKSQKPSKEESNMEKPKVKKQEKQSADEEGPTNSSATEEQPEGNKENMDAPKVEEISVAET